MPHVIAVTGGKGGTGKTFLAVNLAYLFGSRARTLLVDVDVDNPCVKTFLDVKPSSTLSISEFRPEIDHEKCKLCGICVQNCPEHALLMIPERKIVLMPQLCSGCGVCKLVCPFNAIKESKVEAGMIESYKDAFAGKLDAIIGELKPTTRRTAVMILKTLNHVKKRMENYEYVIIDVPAGTGSGIYAAMDFSKTIVAVTEPTRLGLMDLKKLYKLYKRLKDGKRIFVAVNKYGLRGEIIDEVEEFLRESELKWWSIPYDERVVEAYVRGAVLVRDYPESPSAISIRNISEELMRSIKED